MKLVAASINVLIVICILVVEVAADEAANGADYHGVQEEVARLNHEVQEIRIEVEEIKQLLRVLCERTGQSIPVEIVGHFDRDPFHHDDPVIALRRQGGRVYRVQGGLRVNYQGLDPGLKHLKRLPHEIATLDLGRSEVTDEGLRYLADLQAIQFLYLDGTETTDEGLKHLQDLSNVKVLDLSRAKVTGTGFQHLKQMKHLEILRLNGFGDKLSAVGVAALKDLTSLRHLDLRGTKVDANVIKQLKQWPALTSLAFDTKIDAAALEQIKRFAQLKNLEGGLSSEQAVELYEDRPDLNVYNP